MLWVLIKSLSKVLPMSTHNISSHGEIRKYYNSAFLVEKVLYLELCNSPQSGHCHFRLTKLAVISQTDSSGTSQCPFIFF